MIAPHASAITGPGKVKADRTVLDIGEAFRHPKAVAAWGKGCAALSGSGIDVDALGLVTADRATNVFIDSLVEAIGWHRRWQR